MYYDMPTLAATVKPLRLAGPPREELVPVCEVVTRHNEHTWAISRAAGVFPKGLARNRTQNMGKWQQQTNRQGHPTLDFHYGMGPTVHPSPTHSNIQAFPPSSFPALSPPVLDDRLREW